MLNDLQALEEALIEQFKQLDLATKQRLMAQVEDAPPSQTDFELLQKQADMLHDELRKKHGTMSVSDLVNEIREERDDELLRRSGF